MLHTKRRFSDGSMKSVTYYNLFLSTSTEPYHMCKMYVCMFVIYRKLGSVIQKGIVTRDHMLVARCQGVRRGGERERDRGR